MRVLVITERQGDAVSRMSWEALAAGRQFAQIIGAGLFAVAVGNDALSQVAEISKKKLDGIYAVTHEFLASYTADGYARALRQVVERLCPRIVVFPHTYRTRDFAPKLAASFGQSLISDVIGIGVCIRPIFQGKLHAEVLLDANAPQFVSVQSGIFRSDTQEATETPANVEAVEISLDPADIRVSTQEPLRETKGEAGLAHARVIVAVGRGIKDPKHIALAKELAEALGGEVGASRPVCDNGWLTPDRQIGSSGQTVSPKLYVALGISGAIQHIVGMRGSETIIAVNKDPDAPIFDIATYGVVGDLFEVVPALLKALKQSATT